MAAGPTVNVLLVPDLPNPSPLPLSVSVNCERSSAFNGSFALYAVMLAVPTPVPLPQLIAPYEGMWFEGLGEFASPENTCASPVSG